MSEIGTQSRVVYVGRIPHGFYESEMRSYFSQFGVISRLRISRNRTTSASKHYGFIEFKNAEVAKIAAEAMDNYLLFGHLLQCKVVPVDKIHPEMFKGANRTYRVVDWRKRYHEKFQAALQDEAKQQKRASKRLQREEAIKQKLQELEAAD